jgi:hypothetical protein
MEPLSDGELDELLTTWRAPSAPESLNQRVRHTRRTTWWRWLLTGSIRVPVPLTLAILAAFLTLFVVEIGRRPAKNVVRQAKVATFQPVKRLEVRIIRRSYENSN